MLSQEEKDIFPLIREKVEDEYFRNEPPDDCFWLDTYQKLPLAERKKFWWIQIVRYEYMVHGEFKPDSITNEVVFLIKVIKAKDNDNKPIIDYLYHQLTNNMLQVDEISQYMAKKIKENY